MINNFNPSELVDVAKQIERAGVEFYRLAATKVTTPEAKAFLLRLATMEENHEDQFHQLDTYIDSDTNENNATDTRNESIQYLRVLAVSRVFFDKDINSSSMEEILKTAIIIEKDAIAFYLGLKNMITNQQGKDIVDSIISEEMTHVQILSNELITLKA